MSLILPLSHTRERWWGHCVLFNLTFYFKSVPKAYNYCPGLTHIMFCMVFSFLISGVPTNPQYKSMQRCFIAVQMSAVVLKEITVCVLSKVLKKEKGPVRGLCWMTSLKPKSTLLSGTNTAGQTLKKWQPNTFILGWLNNTSLDILFYILSVQ